MTNDDFIERLKARLAEPLPGPQAQHRMANIRRIEELGLSPIPPAHARIACVLNLLHWNEGAWRTVLILRSENPRDRHSGQVSFPGGRSEDSDGNLPNVALREAEEEIGVPSVQIEMIGRLTELYIPISNYVVHPFVGVLHGKAEFRPQPGEVEHILTPAIQVFAQPENSKIRDLTVGGHITLTNVPYYDVDGRIVWGATAMIMSEFVEIMGTVDGGG
jgi:8-oxo-dGTP pyrophosphatase MutT (NUDIX family)